MAGGCDVTFALTCNISIRQGSVRHYVKSFFTAPLRATRQRAQWPRPLHSGPVRQIVPPLRGTLVHSRDLDGPAAIRSCSTRPLAASLRLALVTLIHSAARMPPPVTCLSYR